MNVYYTIRFEVRDPGSIGEFRLGLYDVCAPSPAEACKMAGEYMRAKYETRAGGDWRLTDGPIVWFDLEGKQMPKRLPCQIERLADTCGKNGTGWE